MPPSPAQSRDPMYRLLEEFGQLKQRVDNGFIRMLGDGNGNKGDLSALREDIQLLRNRFDEFEQNQKVAKAFRRGIRISTFAVWTGITMIWQLIVSGGHGLNFLRHLLEK